MKNYSIGRDLGCDVVIDDNTDVVSRRHAVLTVSSLGKMTIMDQSVNGTYVNGIRIAPNEAVTVTRKDTVSFAHVVNLDWNVIPKSKSMLFSLIGALFVAILVCLAIFFAHHNPVPDNPDIEIAADSLASECDTIVADTLTIDSITKPVEELVKDTPKQKGKAFEKVQPQEKETVEEEKTTEDTVKPTVSRPIGV